MCNMVKETRKIVPVILGGSNDRFCASIWILFVFPMTVTEAAEMCRWNEIHDNATQHNTTRHDTTRHNTTRHDTARHYTTKHNKTRHDKTQHDTTTQHNTTQHDTTRHGTTLYNKTQHDTTRHNTTRRHNTTQHNTTRHDTTQHNTYCIDVCLLLCTIVSIILIFHNCTFYPTLQSPSQCTIHTVTHN